MRPLAIVLAALLAVPTGAALASNAHDHGGHGAHGTHSPAATRAGTPGQAQDARRTVRITATDNRYDVGSIPVRAGETIRFVVTNAGKTAHEFAIATRDEQDEHRAMMQQMPGMTHDDPNILTVPPGETRELVWRFGSDTTMTFACNIPGHEDMQGRFAVSR